MVTIIDRNIRPEVEVVTPPVARGEEIRRAPHAFA